MDAEKKKRLEAAGFAVGSVADFLGLTPAEEALIEKRLTLSRALLSAGAAHEEAGEVIRVPQPEEVVARAE